MTPRTLGSALLVLGLVGAAAPVAFAHGGEDHGEVQRAAPTGPGADGRRAAAGRSDAFEVLLKFAPPAADGGASVQVFLSDAASNAPIPGATIELELSGPSTVKVAAEATATPGIYHAIAKVSPGAYTALATIEANGDVDVVEVKAIDLTAAPPPTATDDERGSPWLAIGLGAAALLVLMAAIVAAVRWRAGRSAVVSAASILAIAFSPTIARGHGDDDHGAAPPAVAAPSGLPPGGVYLAKESQFLLGVRTAVAAERQTEARIEAVGRVVPRVDGHATIAAPVPGRVSPVAGSTLPFLGDRVRKGQALFVIHQTLTASDSGALQSQALAARAAAAQARARRDQAQRELDRKRALAGVVAAKEIQQAELELELARRELQLAEQQAALFGGGGLQRVTVTSPIDGTIADANVSIGEQVASDQVLYTVLDASTLWVEASVFEADLARLRPGGAADVRVEGADRALAGTIYRIGQLVDPGTRTTKVIVAVDNRAGSLRSGMFAQVALGAGAARTTLTVPDAAIVEDAGRRFVFVKVGPEVFVRREVVLGARDGDVWTVQQGLVKDERVVTQGTYQLRTAR